MYCALVLHTLHKQFTKSKLCLNFCRELSKYANLSRFSTYIHSPVTVINFPFSSHILQPCDCDPYGSLDNNCDPLTGQCACKSDYNGTQCDSCLFGFYGFPDCSLCLCSVEGTKPESCNEDGACSCTEPDGQCDCKVSCLKNIELKFGFMSHLCITKILKIVILLFHVAVTANFT